MATELPKATLPTRATARVGVVRSAIVDEHLLTLAFRLLRALQARAELAPDEAGQVAAGLGDLEWTALCDEERAGWIDWGEMALSWLMEDTDLPIRRTERGWSVAYHGTPISCPGCHRILGWALPGGELQIVGPTSVLVPKGELRCPCGRLLKWQRQAGLPRVRIGTQPA